MKGYVHIYCGDGKGKTTAAVGLGIRALGNGVPVIFAQFMKDSFSGEVAVLCKLSDMTVLHVEKHFGFYESMTTEQKQKAKELYTNLLIQAIELGRSKSELREDRKEEIGALLILDEVATASNCHLIKRGILLDFLKAKPDNLEVVLTGRSPGAELTESADYISMIRKIRHPFDTGVTCRKGIEM